MRDEHGSGESSGTPLLGWLLARVGEGAASGFRAALPAGVHPRQFAVLRFLAQGSGSGASQRAISAALGIPPSRLVGLLDDLERQGLAVRDQSPTDRRTHLVRLTTAGEELAASLSELATDYDRRLREGLTADEAAELSRLLSKLLASLQGSPGPVW